MKKLALFILTVLISGGLFAQFKPAEKGSTVNFTIKNFGFNVTGTFTGLQGDITFDPANPKAASFDISIDAASVNTDNSLRDSHLREEGYFDVKDYPRIHFVSTNISPAKAGKFVITGKLTIKKQTQEISFPFSATASDGGYLFKGTFNIKRKDYSVGGTSTVSDNLDVSLNILATK